MRSRSVLFSVLVTTFAVLLSGCAATVRRVGPDGTPLAVPTGTTRLVLQMSGRESGPSDWETFKGIWRGALRAESEKNGYRFQALEDDAQPDSEPGVLLAVRIIDYRYLTSGARYGFGIMTGNAFVESQVRFVDMETGSRLGERAYNTTSTAWEGIFSAMTDKQVAVIASEIIRDIRGANRTASTSERQRPAAAQAPTAQRSP